ncbi:MAG: class F sortase [Clostridia bacterium]|nr:class F sortase [Clostridia bacterium]
MCVSLVLFVGGAFLTASQYIYMPNVLAFLGINQTSTPPPIVVMPTPTPVPSGAAPSSPTPYVQVKPVRIYFTERNISCEIQPVGLLPNNAIGTVDDPYIAAWFEEGPAPGEKGNCIINGHVRWDGKAGTFAILPSLRKGEEILIEFENGSQKRFYVAETIYYPFDNIPQHMLTSGDEDKLTLITCHGEWNSDAGTSSQRCFVICKEKDKN